MFFLRFLGNVLFASAISFTFGDAFYVSFVVPKEQSHPQLAQWAGLLVFVFLFLGLFIGNLRVPWSWIGWVFAIVTVGSILAGLHFLK